MPPAGFVPAIPASERSQTHALDRAATGISYSNFLRQKSQIFFACTVESGYNDICSCDTSSIASDVLLYRLITVNRNITVLGYNDTRVISLHDVITELNCTSLQIHLNQNVSSASSTLERGLL